MRSRVVGVSVLFASLGVALAGGVPRDVSKYIQVLKSPASSAKDRADAADIIGKRGAISYQAVQDAIDPLQTALKDKDAKVRGAAALALGKIHPEAKETVPLLLDLVKEEEVLDTKLAAVTALGLYGGDAREAAADFTRAGEQV